MENLKNKIIYTPTVIINNELYETVHLEKETYYINKNGEMVKELKNNEITYKPTPSSSNIVRDNVVLFPSGLSSYESFKDLVIDVRSFIHKYLDIDELFEMIASYYVLLTYIYDRFPNMVYLRFIGDFGSGKSRALDVVGNICYKPIIMTGATTVSPIFRILNIFRGTLIMDEADIKYSETTSEMIKILNNGYQKNRPVLRSEQTNNKNYDVESFYCFGPKILGSRFRFDDLALESRCLTEVMNKDNLREDIPLQLDEKFYNEALVLRNKLLKYRFDSFNKTFDTNNSALNKNIEPRLRQLISIILSIVESEEEKKKIIKFLEESDLELRNDRAMSFEGVLIEAIYNTINFPGNSFDEITVGMITAEFNSLRENEKPLSTQKIGRILKDRLQINTEKTRNGKCLSLKSKDRIYLLFDKYGFSEKEVNSLQSVNIKNNDKVQKEIFKDFDEFLDNKDIK